MIEIECECGRVIKTKDENAGKKAKCPECGEIVQIPAPRKAGSKSPATTSSKGAPAKSAKKRPVPEDEFDDGADPDYGEDEQDEDEDEEELPQSRSRKSSAKKSSKGKADAAEPVAKKKKKKKEGDEADLNKNIIIGTCVFFGIAFLGLVGWGLSKLAGGVSAPTMEVPKAFAEFRSPNGELVCEGPKGWEFKTGGGSGGVPPFLTIEKGSVKIQFKSSQSGASFQMMAQAGGQDESKLPDELKPVSKVHEIQKEKYVQELSGYEEVGPPRMVKAKNAEVRLSEFKASEGFGQIVGYRVTMLGTNNQWNLLCKCSPGDFKDFQPIFMHVIETTSGN